MKNNPALELFKIKTKKLHFDITDSILEKEAVSRMASKLYELLPKNASDGEAKAIPPCLFSLPALLGMKKDVNPSVFSDENFILWAAIISDYMIVFQVFYLLNDPRKDTIYPTITELIPESTDIPLEIIVSLDYAQKSIPHFTTDFEEKSVYMRAALFNYFIQDSVSYDKKVDEQIQKFVQAFFKHTRVPKDLFYTDHTYIQDQLALEELAQKLPDPPFSSKKLTAYIEPNAIENLPSKDKNKAYHNAEKKLQALKIWYTLRVLYPKPEFDDKTKSFYQLQKMIFDKAFFNETNFDRYTNFQPEYHGAEQLIGVALEIYNLSNLVFPRSVWMGVSLLLKEVPFDLMMTVLGKQSVDDVYLKDFQYYLYSHTLQYTHINDDLKVAVLKDMKEKREKLDKFFPQYTQWTEKDKDFLQNVLFICMWEKAFLYSPDAVAEVQENIDKSPNISKIEDRLSRKDLNRIFTECADICELPNILQEATKEMLMSEQGLDYQFLNIKDMSYSEDFLIMLFYLSRREGEIESSLISIVNFLREKQLKSFPIYGNNNKLHEDNFNKLQGIDIGFKLPHFRHSLPPAGELSPICRDRAGFQLHPITVHLVCEVDHAFLESDKKRDWREVYKRNFNKKYLYKTRNQVTHYALDENTSRLLKNHNCATLLQTLFDAWDYYFKKLEEERQSYAQKGVEKCMLRDYPDNFYPFQYLLRTIIHLVQVYGIIIAYTNREKLSSEDCNTLMFTMQEKTFDQSWEKMRVLVFDEEKRKALTLDDKELTDEQNKEISEIICQLYEKDLPNNMETLSKEEQSMLKLDKINKIECTIHFVSFRKDILKSMLNFLFSSEISQVFKRNHDELRFFVYYGAQTSYYLLYLFARLYNEEQQS
ncbi:MAG: hypothetical protein ACRCY4_01675 [Brevinema sp.]